MASLLIKNSHLLLLSSCLPSILLIGFCSSALAHSGIATFYTPPYNPSACYGNKDEGVMIAAASEALWNGGDACGKFYQVSCVGGTNKGTPHPCQGSSSVVVKIVDLCPSSSCRGTIDLSQEAFASIADTASGVIRISYQKM